MNDTTASGRMTTATVAAPGLEQEAEAAVKKILLLDGVRLFLRLEETLLQRSDYQLFTATSGAEALSIMEREEMDLVIMDYVLPDMNGEDVVRSVRESETSGEAGILIVTARGMREHVDRCMAAGCDSFLFKPVSRTVLCARVQEMLQVPARRHVRTLVRLQVNARNRERFFFGNTVNLSAGGVLLETPLDLAVGESLSLRFFLPGSEDALTCESRVVRRSVSADGRENSYGLVFESLDDQARDLVARFVESRDAAEESA